MRFTLVQLFEVVSNWEETICLSSTQRDTKIQMQQCIILRQTERLENKSGLKRTMEILFVRSN